MPTGPLRIHPTAAAVFKALEHAAVRWSLLRGETRLEAPPHDLDFLVARADLEAFSTAVRPLGFIPLPTRGRGSHQFFVAYLPDLAEWFMLDVVTELSYGPGYAVKTGAAPACLERRERVGPVSLLSADDAFWTLLLHCLLDRGDLPAHQLERLRRLGPSVRVDSDLASFTAAICPPGWDAARIARAAAAGDFGALQRLGPQLLEQWRRLHPVRSRIFALAHSLEWRLMPIHTALELRGLRVALVSDERELAGSVAASLPAWFHFPVAVLDGSPSSHGSLIARYHQLRGRLVVLPLANGTESGRRAVDFNPDLIVEVRRDRGDGAAIRRHVTSVIWRAYAEARGLNAPGARR